MDFWVSAFCHFSVSRTTWWSLTKTSGLYPFLTSSETYDSALFGGQWLVQKMEQNFGCPCRTATRSSIPSFQSPSVTRKTFSGSWCPKSQCFLFLLVQITFEVIKVLVFGAEPIERPKLSILKYRTIVAIKQPPIISEEYSLVFKCI